MQKANWLSEYFLQIAEEGREAKGKVERERYTQWNAEFKKIARRDKKVFLTEKCKEIKESKIMTKTRDLFKISKEHFMQDCTQQNRIYKDLEEAEEIKKRWEEYTEELSKKRS